MLHINLSIATQIKPCISTNLVQTTHEHFWSNSHKPGTAFNSPKTEQWAVRGQPNHQTLVPLGRTEFYAHFRSPTHKNTIYYINYDTNYSDPRIPDSTWLADPSRNPVYSDIFNYLLKTFCLCYSILYLLIKRNHFILGMPIYIYNFKILITFTFIK